MKANYYKAINNETNVYYRNRSPPVSLRSQIPTSALALPSALPLPPPAYPLQFRRSCFWKPSWPYKSQWFQQLPSHHSSRTVLSGHVDLAQGGLASY